VVRDDGAKFVSLVVTAGELFDIVGILDRLDILISGDSSDIA